MSPLLFLLCLLPAAAEKSPSPAKSDEFEEPAVRLAPKSPRSEQAEAKVVSAALYAHGRLLLQRGDSAQALRRFQRAWRYDPEAASILPRIVFLARQLRRPEEAARYALIAAERTQMSAALLRQLALQLSARQEWQRALTLFEKSLPARGQQAAQPDSKDDDLAALVVYLEMGRLSLLTRDYAKSAECFSRVRDAIEHPERLAKNEAVKRAFGEADRTFRLMAEGFFQAGRYDEAEAFYRRTYQPPSGKEQPGLLDLQLARIAAKRGQADQALQHLDGYFAAKSSAAGDEPYALLAELLAAKESDKAKAQEQLRLRLEKLLENDTANAALLFAAAELDRQAGRFEPAERRYEQLLVLQAAPEVYAALADLYRQQNRPEKLTELCGILVAKGGGLAELATLLDGVGKSKEQSEAVIARARQQRETDPEHLAAGTALAAALLSAQTHQDAQTADALFSHALSRLEKPSRAAFLLAWGVKLLLDRCYERAAPLFRQATAENLTDERKLAANFYLVRALALSGQTDEALQVAGQAAATFPDSPRLQAQPGWVRYYAKRYAEAEQAYQALLERFDDQSPSPDIRDAMRDARLVLSNICVQQGNTKAAEEWLEQVLDEFPEDIGALNDLGYLWADQGKSLQRALDMVRRAVAGDPDNVAYRDSLGWALYRLGRHSEAIQELEKAAAGDDPDGVILDHLGDAYLRVDRRADALAAWRRAVDAFAKAGEQAKREATQKKIQTCEK